MRTARLLAVLLLLSLTTGCGLVLQGIRAGVESTAAPQNMTTKDKRLQITVPGNWSRNDSLNDEADLGADLQREELYIILLDENKADFDEITLEKHSDLTLGSMKDTVKGFSASEPKKLTINGCPAIQYVVKGTVDNIKVVFVHTTVETKNSFCQMLAWTMNSKWDRNQTELYNVINSFQDLEASPAAQKKD